MIAFLLSSLSHFKFRAEQRAKSKQLKPHLSSALTVFLATAAFAGDALPKTPARLPRENLLL